MKTYRFFKKTYRARILIESAWFPPFGFDIAEISLEASKCLGGNREAKSIWRMEKAQVPKRSPSIQTGGPEDADDEMSPASTVADYAQPTASEDEHRQCRRSPTAKPDVDEDFSVLTTGSDL